MSIVPLKYLSESKLAELRHDISSNRDLYTSGDFLELERDNGWNIETQSVVVDLDLLATLDGTAGRSAEQDIENSIIVHKALAGLTPALASEERIWARLSHIECLGYTRTRWLSGKTGEALDREIGSHIFAKGRTGIRDDNAVSRLWWNMHIASIADPADPEGALRLLAKSADIRQSVIERPGTAARPPLVQAILRAMRREPWLIENSKSIQEFMKTLNRNAGGVMFEALSADEADEFMQSCALRVKAKLAA